MELNFFLKWVLYGQVMFKSFHLLVCHDLRVSVCVLGCVCVYKGWFVYIYVCVHVSVGVLCLRLVPAWYQRMHRVTKINTSINISLLFTNIQYNGLYAHKILLEEVLMKINIFNVLKNLAKCRIISRFLGILKNIAFTNGNYAFF